MNIVLTGATGFLGWHTRCRLQALTEHEVVVATRENWEDLSNLISAADAVLHVAGINRADPNELSQGNLRLAEDVAKAVRAATRSPLVVFANSIQSGNQTPYGGGKSAAADVLRATADELGSTFMDVWLPNLFGEHGRPHYNSFVATFVDWQIGGVQPQIADRPIELLHAQDAAQALIDALSATGSQVCKPPGHPTTVQRVWDQLTEFHRLYSTRGEIPVLAAPFDVALFNTYRSALFPRHFPIPLRPHSDERGRLVETVRSHGGQGQSFVSTTRPGVTRGEHYHLTKIERFAVLTGEARIALRRMFTNEVVEFHVHGEEPVAVDMPTMWTHNITNTGGDDLMTQFWTHVLYDEAAPDTFWVKVNSEECTK